MVTKTERPSNEILVSDYEQVLNRYVLHDPLVIRDKELNYEVTKIANGMVYMTAIGTADATVELPLDSHLINLIFDTWYENTLIANFRYSVRDGRYRPNTLAVGAT